MRCLVLLALAVLLYAEAARAQPADNPVKRQFCLTVAAEWDYRNIAEDQLETCMQGDIRVLPRRNTAGIVGAAAFVEGMVRFSPRSGLHVCTGTLMQTGEIRFNNGCVYLSGF